jgi:hypothetical protein
VPAAAYAVFDELAGRLGTSVPLAMHAAVEVVLVSADNRAKAKKLAMAMRLKVKAAPAPDSGPDAQDAPRSEGD